MPLYKITVLGLLLLAAGCSIKYSEGKLDAQLICVNLTGPGFTLACPETK